MSVALRNRTERVALKGWAKWLLVLLLPLSALSFDTWLNVGMLNRDFEIAEMNQRLKKLGEALDALRIEQARLERQDRCEMEAPDLGLVKPEPKQIEVVYYIDANREIGVPGGEAVPSYAVARLSERRATGYKAQRSAREGTSPASSER